ncbi:MAG TPA: secondary thiamine-phosphate synthase enzyme YjbQ [Polyangiaceae bacterium]|jgi:secondary thiamine-phosphate synthase enzyme|nr:MAG: hypothetical protein BWY17_04764 [Deltaproteobacteria bacterium ADurb.Bin207]HNS98606.1 secondary thiamine-phosphate synthase enzyme YjbQ [Polyangiaceae bacterium]HNZ25471.1 secondary thiamine-phosphate synthase enzyme YjbQ [Polyangiaceae bacterium]HOD25208.1 secondary thiamine-phosphate synthase enzyme YjbQ [Polyangiaceae bacterium]HOE51798.1 secondary thiamine-phosphate synthase enzyme YjbQ [Polyangiaceae bacterium]
MHFATFHKKTTSDTDIIDITQDVRAVVASSKAKEGLVTVGVAGSTASITTIEYESGAVSDLCAAIERLAPRQMAYEHDARWGDGNGYSHVRAALLGPCVSIPLRNGALVLGTWQQLVLCDFDNRGRTREVYVHIISGS